MRTYITIPTGNKSDIYEHLLDEYDFLPIVAIRERDFDTDFMFDDLNDEELTTLRSLYDSVML